MKLIFLILFLITNSFSIAIDKGWYEDTNENLTKIYDEQAKRISLIKNNAVNEEKEQTMRICVAKSRFFAKGVPFKICTDYDHEQFYDRDRTLNLPAST